MEKGTDYVHCPALGYEIGTDRCRLLQTVAGLDIHVPHRFDLIALQKEMLCMSCPKRENPARE